jgi:hypothetical protein
VGWQKKDLFMFIKRLTVGLLVFSIAGILILGCESMTGPAPYLSKPLQNNQIAVVAIAAEGQVPVETVFPLDSIQTLIVNEAEGAMYGILLGDDITVGPPTLAMLLSDVGKITFK